MLVLMRNASQFKLFPTYLERRSNHSYKLCFWSYAVLLSLSNSTCFSCITFAFGRPGPAIVVLENFDGKRAAAAAKEEL